MSKLSVLRKFILPEALAAASEDVGRSAAHPEGGKYYAKAIRNLLDEIDEPVRWSVMGNSFDDAIMISKKNTSEIEDILKRVSAEGAEQGKPPGAYQKELLGDIIMHEGLANQAKMQTIAGTHGGGTAPAILHELGHIRDVQKNPIMNYLHLSSAKASPLSEVTGIAGGKGMLSPAVVDYAGRAPTLLGEIMASANAHRALSSAGAPAGIKWDAWKRLGPSLGTYFFPPLEQLQ